MIESSPSCGRREREWERDKLRESVCVVGVERESVCVRVCKGVRERVCVGERVYATERGKE